MAYEPINRVAFSVEAMIKQSRQIKVLTKKVSRVYSLADQLIKGSPDVTLTGKEIGEKLLELLKEKEKE
jgi:hypothetical protein